jgi:hypothetical protein
MDIKAGVDIAGKGEERLSFGQVGKGAIAIGVELRELGRDMHQLAQLFGGQVGGTAGRPSASCAKWGVDTPSGATGGRSRVSWRGEQRDHARAVAGAGVASNP